MISEFLICPNCKNRVKLSIATNFYECSSCKIIFPIENGVIRLLPSKLEETKLNEEKVNWLNPRLKAIIDNPPWFELISESESIIYMLEQFLPSHDFKGKVLEIGAGACWASSLLKLKYPTVEIIATDISPTILQKGKEVCDLLNSNINWYIATDCEKLPFDNETFDFVFGSASIHHFLNPQNAISEIGRVLKKGGSYLGVAEPMGNRLIRRVWKSSLSPFGNTEKEYGIKENIYSYKEWTKMFNISGFQQVELTLEREWKYYHHHWLIPFYIKLTSFIPDNVFKFFLVSRIKIIAIKTR